MAIWYRYRSPLRSVEVDQIFQGSQLWFSHADQLNDPFELRPHLVWSRDGVPGPEKLKRTVERFAGDKSYGDRLDLRVRVKRRLDDEETRAAYRESCEATLGKRMRQSSICCFCQAHDDILLWSLYADGHRGYCVGFDDEVRWVRQYAPSRSVRLRPEPVIYRSDYPTVDLDADLRDPQVADRLTESVLLSKSDRWNYEHEGRIVLFDVPQGLQAFPRDALACVYLGANIDDGLRQRIVTLCAARAKKPEVYQCGLPKDRYGLEIAKVV